MIHINLLPWREKKREEDKKKYLSQLIVLASAVCVAIFLIYSFMNYQIDVQDRRNALLQTEIDTLNQKIHNIQKLSILREQLIARMHVVYDLEKTRPWGVHLLDEVINVLPQGIYLTQIQRTNNLIAVAGFSDTNSTVSAMMQGIDNNPWLHSAVLKEIKKVTSDDRTISEHNAFNMTFVLQKNKNDIRKNKA